MSDSYSKQFPVSWDELQRNARALSWRLADLGPWKGIITITRGGLVPAAIVSRELDLRWVDTVCVSTYDDRKARDSQVLKPSMVDNGGEGYLLVDDLVDTGKTARIVREALPNAHFATIYAKPAGRPLVDTFITEVSQETWIVFPWDVEPQYKAPIAALKS